MIVHFKICEPSIAEVLFVSGSVGDVSITAAPMLACYRTTPHNTARIIVYRVCMKTSPARRY